LDEPSSFAEYDFAAAEESIEKIRESTELRAKREVVIVLVPPRSASVQ
jgi:hypothetical protein